MFTLPFKNPFVLRCFWGTQPRSVSLVSFCLLHYRVVADYRVHSLSSSHLELNHQITSEQHVNTFEFLWGSRGRRVSLQPTHNCRTIMATYLLLDYRNSEVHTCTYTLLFTHRALKHCLLISAIFSFTSLICVSAWWGCQHVDKTTSRKRPHKQ